MIPATDTVAFPVLTSNPKLINARNTTAEVLKSVRHTHSEMPASRLKAQRGPESVPVLLAPS
jgi:hypothetical protein